MYKLVVYFDRSPREFPLKLGDNLVGSDPICDVLLEKPSIRPTHTKIIIDESGDHSLVSLDPNPTVYKTGHASQRAIPLKAQKVYEIMEDTIFLLAGTKCIIKRSDPSLPSVPIGELLKEPQNKKEEEVFAAPVPIIRSAVRKVPPKPPVRIPDTFAATQVIPEDAVPLQRKVEREFVDVGATQVVGENEYAERIAKEKEELKNAPTLVVEEQFDEEGDTQKLDDDIEEIKQPAKPGGIVDIEKAKWTLSSSSINNPNSSSADLDELFGVKNSKNGVKEENERQLRERILTSPKKDNLSAEEDKKKAKERLYKPAGKKLEPKEDEKVPAGQKRKLVVEPQNSKRRKKDPEEEEDIKQSYKIMVTGKTHFAEYKKMIQALGCEYVDNIGEEFDLLLSESLLRTAKFMIAINRGAKILDLRWLTESAEKKQLLPTKDYILRDEEAEKKWGFSVVQVLEKVDKESKGVFEGFEFYLSKGLVPAYKEMKVLIETGGGKVVPNPSKKVINVLNEKKEKIAIQQYRSQGFIVCGAEPILEAVIKRRFDVPEKAE